VKPPFYRGSVARARSARARDPGAPAWAGALATSGAASGAAAASARAAGTLRTGAVYLALDFETTGLYPAIHRVIEVGALRFRLGADGRPVEEAQLACLVDPGVPMPEDARAVHGISAADLRGAPGFEAVAACLLAMAEGAIIVAHNAQFDLSFLEAELARLGLPRPALEAADTVALARRAFPGRLSYRLGAIAGELGIVQGSAHRALDDARTCMSLFARCAARL
jgi:DNA polymerase III epsilon subunit family exonuclease